MRSILELETNARLILRYQNIYFLSVQMLVISGNIFGMNRFGYGAFGIFPRCVSLDSNKRDEYCESEKNYRYND